MTNLDPSVLSSYRPISSPLFLSKVLERVVNEQLHSQIDLNNTYEKFQFGLNHASAQKQPFLIGFLMTGF